MRARSTSQSSYAAASRLLSSVRSLLDAAQTGVESPATQFSAVKTTTIRTTKTSTRRIRVVLSENVDGVGAAGESVLVASGYARNFLLPRKLARYSEVGGDDMKAGRRMRGLPFAAMKYAAAFGEDVSASVPSTSSPATTTGQSTDSDGSPGASTASVSIESERLFEQQKKEAKKLSSIVRKLTETPVVFKGVKTVNGVLETAIGPAEIRVATAKQLGIEIVDELIDMEGDVLDSPGDFLIPLKLVRADDESSKGKLKMNVRVVE